MTDADYDNLMPNAMKYHMSAEAFREQVVAAVDGPVDFLFIDGDHTEVGVAVDFSLYKGLVREGGLIAFHDIQIEQPFESNQVGRFWRKLPDDLVKQEFVDHPDQVGFGIGLITVPPKGL